MGWLEGLPPRVVEVDCDGARHRIEWRAGSLHLADHDREAEAAFVALGGEADSRCLEIEAAWEEAVARPSIPMWRLKGWPPSGPSSRTEDAPAAAAADGKGLPEPLRVLSILSAIAEIDGDSGPGSEVPTGTRKAVGEFLMERFLAAADASSEPIRRGKARVRIKISCRVVGAAETPSIEAEVGAGRLLLRVGLPLGWLVDVWGRGAAVVDDRVVLTLGTGADGGVEAWALQWELRGRNLLVPSLVGVRLVAADDGRWETEPGTVVPAAAQPWWSVRAKLR